MYIHKNSVPMPHKPAYKSNIHCTGWYCFIKCCAERQTVHTNTHTHFFRKTISVSQVHVHRDVGLKIVLKQAGVVHNIESQ